MYVYSKTNNRFGFYIRVKKSLSLRRKGIREMSTFESTSDERDSTACSDEEFEFITISKEVKMTAFAVVSGTKKMVWTCKNIQGIAGFTLDILPLFQNLPRLLQTHLLPQKSYLVPTCFHIFHTKIPTFSMVTTETKSLFPTYFPPFSPLCTLCCSDLCTL